MSSLVEELTLKIQSSVTTAEEWDPLRKICDPAASVRECFIEKMQPHVMSDASSFAENNQLCSALEKVIALAREVEAWPAGMAAFQTSQDLPAGLGALVRPDDPTIRTAATAFGAPEMHGMCALLWLNATITDIDLDSSSMSSNEMVSLMRVIPERICVLKLADTNFANRGKNLTGFQALCDMLGRPKGCKLHTLGVARNWLPGEAGVMLAAALRSSGCSLTSLDTSGNEISGQGAQDLADAVLERKSMEYFSGISIQELRTNKVYGELDFKGKGLLAAEAHVLNALIPTNIRLRSITIDEQSLPLEELARPPDAEDALLNLQMPKAAHSVASATILGGALARNSALTALNLNYNKLGAEGTKLLADGCSKNTTLRMLGLSYNRMGVKGLVALADMLAQNTTLTALDVSNNDICGVNSFGQGTFSAEGFGKLTECLRRCGIRELNLSANCLAGLNGRSMGKFTMESVERLAEGLVGSHITSLLLDGNQLSSAAAVTLAAGIGKASALQEFGCADCYITDGGADLAGLTEMVAAFRNLEQLALVCMDGNAIGYQGSLLLVPWLREAKNLRNLYVDRGDNRLNEAAETEIKDAILPDVMLHLERGRPSYEASMIKAALVTSQIPTVTQTPISSDAIVGSVPLTTTPMSSVSLRDSALASPIPSPPVLRREKTVGVSDPRRVRRSS